MNIKTFENYFEESELQQVANFAKNHYKEAYYQLGKKRLKRLKEEWGNSIDYELLSPKEWEGISQFYKKKWKTKDEFLLAIQKKIPGKNIEIYQNLLLRHAYHQEEILDILEIYDDRVFLGSQWKLLSIPEDWDGNQKMSLLDKVASLRYPSSKEGVQQKFLSGWMEMTLWELDPDLEEYIKKDLEDQRISQYWNDYKKSDSKWFVEQENQVFSMRAARGYLSYRNQDPQTRGDSPGTTLKNGEGAWKIFTDTQLWEKYYDEKDKKKLNQPRFFSPVGKFNLLIHPKKKQTIHANITNSISWLLYLQKKLESSDSDTKHSEQGKPMETKRYINRVEALKQMASQDSVAIPEEIGNLLKQVSLGTPEENLDPSLHSKLLQRAAESPKIAFELKKARILARRRNRIENWEKEEKEWGKNVKKEFQQWKQGVKDYFSSKPWTLSIPALAFCLLLVFWFSPSSPPLDFPSTIDTLEHISHAGVEKMIGSLRKDSATRLSFFSNKSRIPLPRAVIQLGIAFVDYEVAFQAGDSDQEEKFRGVIIPLLQSLPFPISEKGEGAELIKKIPEIESFLKSEKPELLTYLQLGAWLEGGRLSAKAENQEFFRGVSPSAFLQSFSGTPIPDGVKKSFPEMEKTLSKKTLTKTDFEDLAKLFKQSLDIFK